MAPSNKTSAAGVLALLSEPDPYLQQYALQQLNALVPQFWAEISEDITDIEAFHDNSTSKDVRDLAALIASKVYYYLAEYDEALSFALGAGNLFDVERKKTESAEYVETVVSRAMDRYIDLRGQGEAGDASNKIDPRLNAIIEGIFQNCLEEGEHKQALGIALESGRLDIITRVYQQTQDTDILSYVMEAVLDTGFTLSFRDRVLHHILPLFPPPTPYASHIHSLTRIHVTLALPSLTIPFLTGLVENTKPEHRAIAYQIAFDLVGGGTQEYLEAVQSGLPEASKGPSFERLRSILSGEPSIHLYSDFFERNNHADQSILKDTKDVLDGRNSIFHSALTFSNAFMHAGTNSDEFLRNNLDWLGKASNWSKFTATAALGVIYKGNIRNGTAMLQPYLPAAQGAAPQAGSSAYSEGGALYALGLIHAARGKEVMPLLRTTLRASTDEVVQHGSALGVGIAGMASQDKEAYEDLKQALFTDSAVAGEAAGYAVGLVMLGSGSDEAIEEMLQYAHETQHEKIIRGLAIGIAFICYGRQEKADHVIERLLKEKDPILRYGGVYTLALAYAGTADNGAVEKLLHIAVSDTSDDVRRAAVTSLSFLLFKNPGQVPRMVQLLSESYNPHVRCGATLALGISCAGTGSQDAIDILQPMTKDPVDFVRQGAFVSLAMILVQQSDTSSSLTTTRAMFAKVVGDKHEDPMSRFGAAVGQGLIDAGGRNATISLQSRVGGKNMQAIVGMTLFAQFWYWFPLAHCASLAFEPTAIIGVTEELKTPAFSFVSDAKPSLFAYPTAAKPQVEKAVEKVATAVLSTTAKAKARERTKKAAAAGDAMQTDKPAAPGKEDVEMKSSDEAEASTANPSEVADDATTTGGASPTAPTSTQPPKKVPEPTSETLQNFARVVPKQLAHIVFPRDSRFRPVRAVGASSSSSLASTSTSASSSSTSLPASINKKSSTGKYTGAGGGVLVLIDTRPSDGEPEWVISLADQQAAEAAANGNGHADPTASTSAGGASSIAEDDIVVEPPPPFNYPFGNDA
ncbi:26S proteasome regulatory complex non-ATPase subcomplex Rpn2 Psmd1 subunit [Clavulina sp. PMI_390]|nr:26S proteasome regulatory complex non-ATPase subcomplex Rpn2 Psmd1 subunit [Clavulina sp. PMI_390]